MKFQKHERNNTVMTIPGPRWPNKGSSRTRKKNLRHQAEELARENRKAFLEMEDSLVGFEQTGGWEFLGAILSCFGFWAFMVYFFMGCAQ